MILQKMIQFWVKFVLDIIDDGLDMVKKIVVVPDIETVGDQF